MKRVYVYLDTNMIHDFFVNQAIYTKRGEEPKIPKKFEFMTANKEKLGFVTSFLTKAEIVRELVSAHSMTYPDVSSVWDKFLDSLECNYISKAEFDDNLVDIVAKTQMKLRTMINFLHLFIAIKRNIYFVSGDRDIIKKIRDSGIYTKIMTYNELRDFVEKGDI